MSIRPGVHRLGPDDAALTVHTARGGAAAKAGHDLVILVTAWSASLEIGDDGAPAAMELEADATSLRVQSGTGGVKALDDDDTANIHQTIDDEVLERRDIAFRSTAVTPGGDGRTAVEGELTLAGQTRPMAFTLALGEDGSIEGAATVTQTNWGMQPYSALFGALKVADDVEVALHGHL